MEVRVYTQDLKLKGVSDNQLSVLWTRKYNDVGNFEIHLPITPQNSELYQLNNLVHIYGNKEAGIIEDIKYTQNNKTNKMVIKGRFLESYLDRRLIHPTYNFNGKIEVAMRDMVQNISPAIPLVELGRYNGFDETINFQCSWKSLLNIETKIAQAGNLGYRLRPDFTEKRIYFEVYKGLNRTRNQHERSFTEFSDEFNNIDATQYSINNKLEKNVAYVLGEGEGENRTVVVVGDDSLQGYDRRELYVDARDLQSTDITQAEYIEALRQRGLDKLQENIISRAIECTTNPNGNFKYKVNYDLGDVVTVKKSKWGLCTDLRVTEVMEVYEHEIMRIVPTLGNPLPTTLNLED